MTAQEIDAAVLVLNEIVTRMHKQATEEGFEKERDLIRSMEDRNTLQNAAVILTGWSRTEEAK